MFPETKSREASGLSGKQNWLFPSRSDIRCIIKHAFHYSCKSLWITLTGSLYASGKLPTYPSPKSTFTFTCHLGQNVGLGEGQVGSFQETSYKQCTAYLHYWLAVVLLLFSKRFDHQLTLHKLNFQQCVRILCNKDINWTLVNEFNTNKLMNIL